MFVQYLLFMACLGVIAFAASTHRSLHRAARDLDPLIINPDLAQAEAKSFWNGILAAFALCLALIFTRDAQDQTLEAEAQASSLQARLGVMTERIGLISARTNAPAAAQIPAEMAAPAAPIPTTSLAVAETPVRAEAVTVSLGYSSRILLRQAPAGPTKGMLHNGTKAYLTETPAVERGGRRWSEIRMSLDGAPVGWVATEAIHPVGRDRSRS